MLLGQALILVLAIRGALLLLPFRLVRPVLARAARPIGTERLGVTGVDRIAWAVSAVARVVVGTGCLTQALAAQILLARAGQASDLRIGVARNEGRQVRAHAWLESRGRIVIGAPLASDLIPLPLHGSRYEPELSMRAAVPVTSLARPRR